MSDDSGLHLNGYLLRQAATCPLKLGFYQKFRDLDSGGGYKNQTKKVIAEAVASQYPGGKRASAGHHQALKETMEWLGEKKVTVYGGVVGFDCFHARCPVLIKEGDQILLIQIHGKALNGSMHVIDPDRVGYNRFSGYLREASYKRWVLESLFPELNVDVRLCFPRRDYRADSDNLYQRAASMDSGKYSDEWSRLFVELEAGMLTRQVLEGSIRLQIHPFYSGDSFAGQIQRMGRQLREGQIPRPFRLLQPAAGVSIEKIQVTENIGAAGGNI